MTAYALAHLRPAAPHLDVCTYIERVQSTMDPFGGRFLTHAKPVEVIEGDWPGAVVIVAFPSLENAREWYDSPAYREILPLRTEHIDGELVFVDGVPSDYDAAAFGQAMRAALT